MNVLFIFSRHSKDNRDSTLTKDLSDEFAKMGCNSYVVTMEEHKYGKETSVSFENHCYVLRVKTGNYFSTNKFEKAVTILKLPRQIFKAIVRNFGGVKFNLIITHTPFMSSPKLILPLKKYFKCSAHLLLWDIFPQNAVDLNLIKNKVIIQYFRLLERKMLSAFDMIWCMSIGNVNYLKENYLYLNPSQINLLYNYATYKPVLELNKIDVRRKYGYSAEDIIALFGGNMGVPQQLENLLTLAEYSLNLVNAKFLFVGTGTELKRLMELSKIKKLDNVKFIAQLPRDDYELLTAACDIGLVSLDTRFTVPNFPSKTTDYFKLQLPILASLDNCAAVDYGIFLTTVSKAGVFALASEPDNLLRQYTLLYENELLRCQLGKAGRQFFELEQNVNLAYKKIVNSL